MFSQSPSPWTWQQRHYSEGKWRTRSERHSCFPTIKAPPGWLRLATSPNLVSSSSTIVQCNRLATMKWIFFQRSYESKRDWSIWRLDARTKELSGNYANAICTHSLLTQKRRYLGSIYVTLQTGSTVNLIQSQYQKVMITTVLFTATRTSTHHM